MVQCCWRKASSKHHRSIIIFLTSANESIWFWNRVPVWRNKDGCYYNFSSTADAPPHHSANPVLFPTSVFPFASLYLISSCPLTNEIHPQRENASIAFLRLIWESPQIPLPSPFSAQTLPECVKPRYTAPSHFFSHELTRFTLISGNTLFLPVRAISLKTRINFRNSLFYF